MKRMSNKTDIKYAIFTNQGDRPVNEDSAGGIMLSQGGGFFLSDGLGGHGCGDIASKLAVSTGKELLEKGVPCNDILKLIFSEIQRRILTAQKENIAQKGMKTTFNAIIIGKDNIFWGHIGDSRTYRFTRKLWGIKYKRTMDHSVPQLLVNSGRIKENEIRHHQDRNRLMRAMGAEWTGEDYEIEQPESVNKPQAYLMCSDGFWELIEENQMIEELKKAKTPETWLSKMAKIVEKNGYGKNMDNYTAVAVWINWS